MEKTDRFTKVAAVLVFLALAAYVGYYVWHQLARPVVTAMAVTTTVRESTVASGLVVRDEMLLTGSGGSVQVAVDEGQHVSAGAPLAVELSSEAALTRQSRIQELNDQHGAYSAHEAAMDHALHILNLKLDNMQELTYADRKRVHNLKYYTWVEQQGRTVEELNALWYDTEGTWDTVHKQAKDLDDLINEFNEATGLLKNL